MSVAHLAVTFLSFIQAFIYLGCSSCTDTPITHIAFLLSVTQYYAVRMATDISGSLSLSLVCFILHFLACFCSLSTACHTLHFSPLPIAHLSIQFFLYCVGVSKDSSEFLVFSTLFPVSLPFHYSNPFFLFSSLGLFIFPFAMQLPLLLNPSSLSCGLCIGGYSELLVLS